MDIPESTKRDIQRIQQKLDGIQPNDSPTLDQLQNQLQEIKGLLQRNGSSMNESRRKQVIAALQRAEQLLDLAVVKNQSKQSKLVTTPQGQ